MVKAAAGIESKNRKVFARGSRAPRDQGRNIPQGRWRSNGHEERAFSSTRLVAILCLPTLSVGELGRENRQRLPTKMGDEVNARETGRLIPGAYTLRFGTPKSKGCAEDAVGPGIFRLCGKSACGAFVRGDILRASAQAVRAGSERRSHFPLRTMRLRLYG